MCMLDNYNRANVLHYGSSRCHKAARYVMVAEVHALDYAFDHAYTVRKMFEQLLGREILLEAFADSRRLFNDIANHNEMAEQGLLNDIYALKEGYKRGEFKRIGWIPGNENTAVVLRQNMITRNLTIWILMDGSILQFDDIG